MRQASVSTTWQDLLLAARTEEDLLLVVRDYLATWTPEELKALPETCKTPSRVVELEEVVDFAFTLAQARLAGKENSSLIRMSRFFMEAAQCVGTVMNRDSVDAAND